MILSLAGRLSTLARGLWLWLCWAPRRRRRARQGDNMADSGGSVGQMHAAAEACSTQETHCKPLHSSPSCCLFFWSRTKPCDVTPELLIWTSEWWLLREGRLWRSDEMVELPPLLPPLAAQLERYLTQPELLPLHDTAPAQQSWWVGWSKKFHICWNWTISAVE